MNTKVMHDLTCGLYMLSSRDGEKRGGCIINTVMQVTSKPLRITITVNKQNNTHDLIQASGVFAVSLLDQSAPFGLFQHFGFQSGRDVDKFAGLNAQEDCNGVPYLTWASCGYLSCKVVSSMDLGTHTQFLADVVDCDRLEGAEPLSYSYYQTSIKPKPEKKPEVKGWRCTICGYIYEGEELPEDYVCPLCKHGPEAFEKIT
jgi:flavin reductase (DIM6/NTAB) family NADH-FMN oxidoreductase RutF/rubredoxin